MRRKLTLDELEYVQSDVKLKGKSTSLSYVLAILLGPLGIHLGYLEKIKSAVMRFTLTALTVLLFFLVFSTVEMLQVSELTMRLQQYSSALSVTLSMGLGIQLMWLMYDLIAIPKWIRKDNEEIEEESSIAVIQANYVAEDIRADETSEIIVDKVSKVVDSKLEVELEGKFETFREKVDLMSNDLNERKLEVTELSDELTSKMGVIEELSITLKNRIDETTESLASEISELENLLMNEDNNMSEMIEGNSDYLNDRVDKMTTKFNNLIDSTSKSFAMDIDALNEMLTSEVTNMNKKLDNTSESMIKEVNDLKSNVKIRSEAIKDITNNIPIKPVIDEKVQDKIEPEVKDEVKLEVHDESEVKDEVEPEVHDKPEVQDEVELEVQDDVSESKVKLGTQDELDNSSEAESTENTEIPENTNESANETIKTSDSTPESTDKSTSNTLTVKDALNSEGVISVEGYIVGFMNSDGSLSKSGLKKDSNIVISDSEDNIDDVLVIQLSKKSGLRNEFGLKSSPDNLGKKATVIGSKSEYFNTFGIKEISKLELID